MSQTVEFPHQNCSCHSDHPSKIHDKPSTIDHQPSCLYILPAMSKTLFEKIWDRHVVETLKDGSVLLYIDRQLVHEVTSAQAFEGLRLAGRKVRRPNLTFATMDHNIPTDDPNVILDPISKASVDALETNCAEFGVTLYGLESDKNGVVHIIGPELGLTLSGNDDRLRRLAHRHPRRVWRAGVRHRHVRGRTRAGHADSAPEKTEDIQGRVHRPPAESCHIEGHDPEADRPDRHGRRHGLCCWNTPARRFARCRWKRG